jgi:hypothetical protein
VTNDEWEGIWKEALVLMLPVADCLRMVFLSSAVILMKYSYVEEHLEACIFFLLMSVMVSE